nr:hypothetical protein [Tanacetum cinerariifolium]
MGEFGDSYVAPKDGAATDSASEGTATKKGRTVAITTEDMQKRRNDVKARITLLLALPDEHQLRFSKYKTTQELWAAIQKTFGGNEATKKTKKNLLKQQYRNYKAEGSETLKQTFNRLQVIVSQLEFMDIEIEQDDLNQKFLTSLAPEWFMHIIKKSESNSQNMAFISSSKNNSGNEEVNTASIPTTSTKVSLASANIGTASISLDTACAYIASQSNGSQIKYKDIYQIDEDDIEEMDIKWNMALLSMRAERYWKKTGKKISIQGIDVAGFDKSKVECFNYHKMGHFTRDFMANEEKNHALVANEEAPTEFALMAKTSAESEVFDNSLCSKTSLSQVKGRLVEFKNQEIKFCEKIRGLEFSVECKANRIKNLTNELETLKKEKEGLDSKLLGFKSATKDLDNLIGSQRSDKNKEESNPNDLQNNSSSVSEIGESTGSILSKPEIKFVKAADSPTVVKTDKKETVRKPTVKYAELYRKTSKRSNVRGNQRN